MSDETIEDSPPAYVDGFEFALGTTVTIKTSGESGKIQGRAEYLGAENNYLVRYKAADGRATEQWWQEGALEAGSA